MFGRLTEDPALRNQIESSLNSIVESSQMWLARLRKRQREVRLITAFFTAILIFVATLIVGTIVVLVSANVLGPTMSPATVSANFTNFLNHHPGFVFEVAAPAFLTGPASFIITYLLMKRKHEKRMKELDALIKQMKKKITAQDQSAGPLEDAFSLTEQIFTLLPEVVRNRKQDSMLFGFVAFVIALVGGNFAVAILVGVIVWIYFRYEFGKNYEQGISRFEAQRKIFEQRKKDFIETL
jgi:hypothetical protein